MESSPLVPHGEVTEWLSRWRAGAHQALDHVVPLVYTELRQLARRQLSRETAATLSATALVHEVYLRLLQQRQIQAADRESFLAISGRVMRRILIDHARARRRAKRPPAGQGVDLDPAAVALITDAEVEELLAVDAALDTLAAADPRAARVVEYRVFAGLTVDETATVLGVSGKTVQRTWRAARAWLRKELAR
jgi:RNA polymerase sigma-70 factor, ECF subfamily